MGFGRWYNAQKAGVQIAVAGGIVVMVGGVVAGCRTILFSAARLAYKLSIAPTSGHLSSGWTGLFAFAGSTFPASTVVRMTGSTECVQNEGNGRVRFVDSFHGSRELSSRFSFASFSSPRMRRSSTRTRGKRQCITGAI